MSADRGCRVRVERRYDGAVTIETQPTEDRDMGPLLLGTLGRAGAAALVGALVSHGLHGLVGSSTGALGPILAAAATAGLHAWLTHQGQPPAPPEAPSPVLPFRGM